MELKNFFTQDSQGNVVPFGVAYLYAPGTNTLATGLKDAAGAALGNPWAADAKGKLVVAAPDGDYDLRMVAPGRDDVRLRVRFIDATALRDQAVAAANTATDKATTATSKAGEATAGATTATQMRDAARAWAEGAAPGGAGTKSAREWAQAFESFLGTALHVGPTRPAVGSVLVGYQHYDTMLKKPVWSDGADWLDAVGNSTFRDSDLFADGTQGVWLDLQGLPELFTDVAGTTPAAYGDAVAMARDRSGRGNHFTQPDAAARPIYGRHPKGGRRNLLANTGLVGGVDRIDGAAGANPSAWGVVLIGLGSVRYVIDTENGDNAVRCTCTDGTSRSAMSRTVTLVAGSTYTLSVVADVTVAGTSVSQMVGWFNLPAGSTIAYQVNGVEVPAGTVPAAGRHTLACVIVMGPSDASTTARYGVGINNPVNGDAVLRAPQLERGTARSSYQRAITDWNVVEPGVPDVRYLYATTDDAMATQAVNFIGTGKVTMIAAQRKTIDNGAGIVAEIRPSGGNASFTLFAPRTAGPNYGFQSLTTAQADANISNTAFTSPHTAILVGEGDIAGDVSKLTVNNGPPAVTNTDQGSAVYSNSPITMFARAGGSVIFNGYLYDLLIVGKSTTPKQIAVIQARLNAALGAY
jgi:hypothetical protein